MSELDSIFNDDWSEDHRSGVIAVVGRPNVGKSTLVNALLGQKIAITTPKPQTTRRNQLGIYTDEKVQILFVDTPGLHKPHNKLGEYMLATAETALKDADIILWILDVSEEVQRSDDYISETFKNISRTAPLILILNKIDLVKEDKDYSPYLALTDTQTVMKVSAATKAGVPQLLAHLISLLPLGPRYYPADQVSDMNLRFMVGEIIREKAMNHTEQEVPHSLAVEVFDYKDKEERTEIYANIYVEKDSQKGIIIGKNGQMIKQIGIEARKDIQVLVERPVFLDLHVKVQKDWRSNEIFMRRMGYFMPSDEE